MPWHIITAVGCDDGGLRVCTWDEVKVQPSYSVLCCANVKCSAAPHTGAGYVLLSITVWRWTDGTFEAEVAAVLACAWRTSSICFWITSFCLSSKRSHSLPFTTAQPTVTAPTSRTQNSSEASRSAFGLIKNGVDIVQWRCVSEYTSRKDVIIALCAGTGVLPANHHLCTYFVNIHYLR